MAPKTLFATHYHELNELETKLPRVKNFHITNKEVGNKIIFLRKLAPGGSVHSFGIHVAKMAGMPPSLIDRANAILLQLEEKHVNDEIEEGDTNQQEGKETTDQLKAEAGHGPKVENLKRNIKRLSTPQIQLSIFDVHSETFESMRKMLTEIDINRLTPVEALLKLNEVKALLK
jgi:DNA mismatch repair protein MutS